MILKPMGRRDITGKKYMKKIILLFLLAGCLASSSFGVTSTIQNQPYYPILTNQTIDEGDVVTFKVTVLSVTSTSMELLVEANNAVYEFCEYFNNSWVDIGLSLYCTFGGSPYGECVIYKAMKAACGISGAIKLYLEGDISGAIKAGIKTGQTLYSISKMSERSYKLTEALCRSNN